MRRLTAILAPLVVVLFMATAANAAVTHIRASVTFYKGANVVSTTTGAFTPCTGGSCTTQVGLKSGDWARVIRTCGGNNEFIMGINNVTTGSFPCDAKDKVVISATAYECTSGTSNCTAVVPSPAIVATVNVGPARLIGP
jgi:hypothetical protein